MFRLHGINLLQKNHMSQKSIDLNGTNIWENLSQSDCCPFIMILLHFKPRVILEVVDWTFTQDFHENEGDVIGEHIKNQD